MSAITINGERIWDSLMTHGEIGGLENGGVCREALTSEDIEGRDTFVRWCQEASMTVATDALGTIYATRAGTDDSLEPLAIGSHLDTQPTGGKFDGILGVLSGLDVSRAISRYPQIHCKLVFILHLYSGAANMQKVKCQLHGVCRLECPHQLSIQS